jgi:hypothetical protein
MQHVIPSGSLRVMRRKFSSFKDRCDGVRDSLSFSGTYGGKLDVPQAAELAPIIRAIEKIAVCRDAAARELRVFAEAATTPHIPHNQKDPTKTVSLQYTLSVPPLRAR